MPTQPFRLTFYFLLIISLFFSCKKEEKKFDTLELTVEVVDGKYICSWAATNISTFEYYHLFYSKSPINEQADIPDFDENAVIYDQETNTFNFIIQDIEPISYFQLQVNIGDRNIKSNVVTVTNEDVHILFVNVDEVIHYPEKNALYFSEKNTNRFIYYDLVTKEIKKERSIDFQITAFTTGKNGDEEELYLIADERTLTILDANTLEEKATKEFTSDIFSVVTNDKGIIFLTVQESGSPLQVFLREGLTLHDSHNYISYFNSRGLAFLSKENNLLLEVEANKSYLYDFEDNGDLSGFNSNAFSSTFTINNNIITISPEKNYYVKSSSGVVFNAAMERLFVMIELTNRSYKDFAFDLDETYLYAAINTSSSFAFKFHRLSIPDFQLEEKQLNYYTPLALFNDGEKIMAVTQYSTSNLVKIFPLIF